MARLLDDIRRGPGFSKPWHIEPAWERSWAAHARTINEQLKTPMPIIAVDNVAHYYYESSGQEHWDLREHFPNIAPPFDAFWMEHKIPKRIHSDEKGDIDNTMVHNGRVGMLFVALTPTQFGSTRHGAELHADAKWIYMAEQFFDWGFGDPAMGPVGTWIFQVDANGRLAVSPFLAAHIDQNQKLTEVLQAHLGWFHPSLLAISFMHCRNVVVVDNETPPKLAKKILQRTGHAPSDYKTLIIEPLKEILRREGGSHEKGLPNAMHICRGHFRDYREGKGLFGKYKQLVWTPAVVRGSGAKRERPEAREIEIKL